VILSHDFVTSPQRAMELPVGMFFWCISFGIHRVLVEPLRIASGLSVTLVILNQGHRLSYAISRADLLA